MPTAPSAISEDTSRRSRLPGDIVFPNYAPISVYFPAHEGAPPNQVGAPGNGGRVRQKERLTPPPLESGIDLRAKYSFSNMLTSCLNAEPGVNHALIYEFKAQGDVKMFRQLPDCDNLQVPIYQMGAN